MNRFPHRGQLAICLLLLLAVSCFAAESRTWTSTDGRELNAELVRVEGDSVVVRRVSDWRVFTIPLESLSEADQAYVAGLEKEASPAGPYVVEGAGGFPEGGLVWPDKVEAPGDFEVEILEENNDTGVYRYRAGHFSYTSDIKLARKVVAEFAEVFEATYNAVRATPLDWGIEAPKDGYTVRLFDQLEGFEMAGGIPGSAGTYSPRDRVILVPMASLGVKKSSTGVTLDSQAGHGTLIHEITHQVQHDWMYRLPVWLIEGFAVYIESVPYKRGIFDFGDLEPDEALQAKTGATDEFTIVSPEKLMTMSGADWNANFGTDAFALNRQYASAFLLTYYFAHLDGDGRHLWEALRVFEGVETMPEWNAARKRFDEILLAGRTYDELFDDMQRDYRSEGIKLVGTM